MIGWLVFGDPMTFSFSVTVRETEMISLHLDVGSPLDYLSPQKPVLETGWRFKSSLGHHALSALLPYKNNHLKAIQRELFAFVLAGSKQQLSAFSDRIAAHLAGVWRPQNCSRFDVVNHGHFGPPNHHIQFISSQASGEASSRSGREFYGTDQHRR